MDTAHLKAFLRIAETGSISRASLSLGISQPSLSQQMLRLEDEVGIALFERSARGVTLTEGGRVFRERARHILESATQAVADARHLRREAPGQVVFAMPPSVAQLVGAPLVEALAEHAPRARVRVVEAFSGAILGWIEEEKIDLGILYEPSHLHHLLARPLARDALVALGPPGRFGGAGEDGLTLAGLAGEALIAPGRPHGLRQLLDREAGRAGVALTIDQEIDSLDTAIALVARGRGIAILPLCAARAAITAGQVSVAHFSGGGLWRRLSLIRNPSHILTHASVRVEGLVRGVMAQLIATGAWEGMLEAE